MKFGDIVENTAASDSNPRKLGVFVRVFMRKGKVNPGKHVELTDMNGEFWETDLGDHLKVVGSTIKTYPVRHGFSGALWRSE